MTLAESETRRIQSHTERLAMLRVVKVGVEDVVRFRVPRGKTWFMAVHVSVGLIRIDRLIGGGRALF
jgi:hypothetical protein